MRTRVSNMQSLNGNEVANQFEIETATHFYFQSYKTIIAKYRRKDGQITLDRYKWDYSKTTGKYRNIFTGMDINETRKAIKSGDIKLADLNK